MTMPPSGTSSRSFPWILVIFLAGLVFRGIYFIQCNDFPLQDRHFQIFDSQYYDIWARSIAAGDWMGREAFFMGPLYPYFLGIMYTLFGPDFIWIRLIQTVLGSLTCVGVYLLGRRIFNQNVGLVGAFLCTFYSLFFFYENLLLATSLVVFLTLLSCFLIVEASQRKKLRWWLISGLSIGLGAVAKANFLLIIPFVLIWIAFQGGGGDWAGKSRRAVWFVLGVVLMVAPVTIRNAIVQKEFILLTSNGGLNFYIGNNPESNGIWDRYEFPWFGATLRDHLTARRLGEPAYRDQGPSEISSMLIRDTMDSISEDPKRALALLGKKSLLVLNAHEVTIQDNINFWKRFSWFLRLPFLGYGILAPLGIVGILLCLRQIRRCYYLYLMAGVPIVTMIILFVLARYRLPAVPFISLFAAKALIDIVEAIKKPRYVKLFVLIAIMILSALVVHRPIEDLNVKLHEGSAYASYGKYLSETGRHEEALVEMTSAVELEPDNAAIYLERGFVLETLGRLSGALADYREASRLDPDNLMYSIRLAGLALTMNRIGEAEKCFRDILTRVDKLDPVPDITMPASFAYIGLGQIELDRGNDVAAESAFREALRVEPNNPEAHYALAVFLSKKPEQAEEALSHAALAVQIKPSAKHLSFLGWMHFQAGRLEKAQTLLKKAQGMKPNNPLIAERLRLVEQALKGGAPR